MPASNTVDIYFKGHESGLRKAIRDVKAELQSLRDQTVNIKVDVDDRALRRLRAQMDSVRNNVTQRVRTAVDSRELTELRSQLSALRDRTVRVGVELNSAGALAGLAAFDSARGNARLALDLDTRVAAAELATFIAAAPRTLTMNLDLDTGTAAAELAAFRLALLALNNDTVGLGTATRTASRGMSAMGGAASGMLPKLVALAPAVSVLASGAVGAGIYGTAAALGAVTAAAGLVSIGFGSAVAALPIMAAATSDKVRDHFKFMADDVVTTMKEISKPLQDPLVGLATSLGAAFHQIRPNLERITTGVGDLINELSGKMPAIAAEVGPAMEKMFQGAVPHIRNLTNELPNIIRSIGDFAGKLGDPAIVEGAQRVFGMIPGIISGAGDLFVDIGEKFNAMMTYLDSGKLDGFTQGFQTFMDNMGATDWSGVTEGLTDMANSFGDFMGKINTDNLAQNLTGLEQFVADLTRLSAEATAKFQELDDAFRQTNSQAGGGPVEWGGKLADITKGAINQLKQDLADAGIITWKPEIEVETPTLEVDPPDVAGAFDNLLPATIPAPPLEAPDTSVIAGALNNLVPDPLTVPLEPAPMPAPEPPLEPVKIETQAELTNLSQPDIPPLKVPVEYDTTGIGTLTIQAPEPIKVPVEILPPPPPDMSAFTVDLSAQGAAAGASFAAGLAGSAGAVAGAAASMAAAAQSVSVDLSGQGAAAGASFAAGIRSQAGAVASAAAELGRIAAANKGHYKGRKGIAADRIMLIPHGQAMVKGFIGGMQSQKRDLIRAAQTLASDVYTAFDDDLVPNIGLAGGMEIKQKVVVQVEAGLMADPVKIGREVRDVLDQYAGAVGGSVKESV